MTLEACPVLALPLVKTSKNGGFQGISLYRKENIPFYFLRMSPTLG